MQNIWKYKTYCGEGNGTPLQYSCLENPMDGEAWKAAVHGVAEGQTWLSNFTFTFPFHALEKEMATHSSVLAWRIQGRGSLVGCRLWGHTESDMTEVTQHGSASSVCGCKPKKTVLELYSYSMVTVKENGERKSSHWAKLWEICICLQLKKKKVTSAKWLSTADQGFRRRNTERFGSRKSIVGAWDVDWHMEMDSKSKGFILHIIPKENLW